MSAMNNPQNVEAKTNITSNVTLQNFRRLSIILREHAIYLESQENDAAITYFMQAQNLLNIYNSGNITAEDTLMYNQLFHMAVTTGIISRMRLAPSGGSKPLRTHAEVYVAKML
jgi:hypothetical protein